MKGITGKDRETLADFLEKYMKDTEENQEKGYSVSCCRRAWQP